MIPRSMRPDKKQYHRIHEEVVDGVVRNVKACQRCGRTLIAEDTPDSGFTKAGSYKGRQYFNGRCKRCESELRLERIANDPVWAAKDEERRKANHAAWLEKPGVKEKRKQASKDHYYRRKNDPVKHRKMLEDARIDRRLRMARKGKTVKQYEIKTVIDNTKPRVDAGPFLQWLNAYGLAAKIETRDEKASGKLGDALHIEPRRITSLRAGASREVELSIVDTALLNAVYLVRVNHKYIYTLEDLYPLSE